MYNSTARRWAAIIDEAARSGMTNRAFADAAGINANTLTWWKWRLRNTRRTAVAAGFIEVVEQEDDECDFEPVRLQLRDSVTIVVDDRTDLELLRAVVDALC